MGYAWKGTCYLDTATALKAIKKDIPTASDTGYVYLVGEQAISPTGYVTFQVYTGVYYGSPTIKAGAIQLQTCDALADNKFELLAVQDVLAAIGIGLAFVVGIVAGNMR